MNIIQRHIAEFAKNNSMVTKCSSIVISLVNTEVQRTNHAMSLKMPNFIPMFCYNLLGYDAHLFIRTLCETAGWTSCIPTNSEKYISFSKKIVVGTYMDKKDGKMKDKKVEISFLDSMRFMDKV